MNDARKPSPTVVALHAECSCRAPIGALTSLLAEAVARELDESVLVIHPVGGTAGVAGPWSPLEGSLAMFASPGGGPAEGPRPGGVTHAFVPEGHGAEDLAARVQEALDARGRDHAWAFVELSPEHRGAAQLLAPRIGRAVLLTRDHRLDPPAVAGSEPLITEVLPSSAMPRVTGLDALRQAIVSPRPPRRRGAPWRRGPERCRVRLDLPGLRRMRAPSLAHLGAGERAAMARWARALGRRRIGLALGGGGAFCFAHVALIEGLLAHDVPIDLVAGTGSGALVGAYYCALGREGLHRLVERGPLLERGVGAAMISPAILEWLVTHDLGHLALEDLEVPLYPAATNLTTGQREVIRDTSVAFGVRASSSTPGLFGATFAHGARYVGGAVGQNVPAPLARAMGASLVIAGDGSPASARGGEPPPPSRLGRIFAQVSPTARVRDLALAFDLLCREEGDLELGGRTVLCSLTEPPAPGLERFGFSRAREIVAAARADPAMEMALDRAERAYRAVVRPPGPVAGARRGAVASV